MNLTLQATIEQNGIVGLLSDDDIKRLQAGYSAEAMIQAATKATIGLYPQAAGLIDYLNQHFFITQTTLWDPRLREGAIISLLTVHSDGAGLLLVVHFYWGLMENLSIGNICELLLLTGIYTGLPNFTEGVTTMKRMLVRLRAMLDDGEDLDCVNVIGEMRKIFN
jgi:hypothetical protein